MSGRAARFQFDVGAAGLLLLLAVACGDNQPAQVNTDAGTPTPVDATDSFVPAEVPPPTRDWVHHGPGGPNRTFTEDQLFNNCAFLDGGGGDIYDHHDIAVMFDGYLLLPWAPEFGKGGLTFFDVSDPCAPRVVGATEAADMRETHVVSFSRRGGVWMVANTLRDNMNGGIAIWDVSDTRAPRPAARLDVPGFFYPDGYSKVVFWAFWQGQYLYLAAGDNGIVIVDAGDPTAPRIVRQFFVEPFLRVHQLVVVGNLMFVTQSDAARGVLLDVSDPTDPQPIPGGDFTVADRTGAAMKVYSSNYSGGYGYFTRKDGGGVGIYDLRDPTRPTFVGDQVTTGGGAYVFLQEPYLFVGNSQFGSLLDVSDPAAANPTGTFRMQGDLDFVSPIGNVAVLSVDESAEPNRGSAIVPWRREPDRTPPRATFSVPAEGAANVPVTSRIGVTFGEAIDAMSAWRTGSVVLRELDGVAVDIDINAQDTILNISPIQPLKASTRYRVEIAPGGIEDWSGNAVVVPFQLTFETAAL